MIGARRFILHAVACDWRDLQKERSFSSSISRDRRAAACPLQMRFTYFSRAFVERFSSARRRSTADRIAA